MKRFWLGIGILVGLLGLGIGAQGWMDALHTPCAAELEQAAQEALQDNWSQALLLAEQASSRWEQTKKVISSLADHTPMDEVDMLLAELHVYARAQEVPHFAACCTQLAAMIQAIGQAHAFNWWNLL